MTDGRLQWHPGFSAALRVELEEELDELCIEDKSPEDYLRINEFYKELSKEENYWLQNLRCNLKTGEEIQEVVRRYEQVKHKAYYPDVMNLIVRANQKQMEEEKNMCEALNELFAEELKEADLRGQKEGRNVGKKEELREQVQKKLARNQSVEKHVKPKLLLQLAYK